MVVLVVGLVGIPGQPVGRAGTHVHEALHASKAGKLQQVAGAGEVDVQDVFTAGSLAVGPVYREHGGVDDFVDGVGLAQRFQSGDVQYVASDEVDP